MLTASPAVFALAAGRLTAGPARSGETLTLVAKDTWGAGEIATSAALPGSLIYEKKVFALAPTGSVLRELDIEFSAQADTHGGAALQMYATVDGKKCEPINTGSGAAASGVYTLNKLPLYDAKTLNCNDGGGGGADCHDNTIYFDCCIRNTNNDPTVRIFLASSKAGQTVFFEEGTVKIMGTKDSKSELCTVNKSPPWLRPSTLAPRKKN